jgi:two-component system, cell cycle response regulator DivK
MSGAPILIIDDNPANMKLLRFVLLGQGYEVREAVDAEQALEILGAFRPRLILMDLQLPGVGGLELTRRLKADPVHRHAIIIAVTASAMKGDEEKAVAAGCDGYVTKPIDTRTLPKLIASYLELSA